jgi:hypothetical protein
MVLAVTNAMPCLPGLPAQVSTSPRRGCGAAWARVTLAACLVGNPAGCAEAQFATPAPGLVGERPNYGLPRVDLEPADLGLASGQALLVPLAGRFDEALVQLTLQGAINQTAPTLWLRAEDSDDAWLQYYRDQHGIDFSEGTFEELVHSALPQMNGLVLYDENERNSRALLAFNLAHLSGLLPVSRRLYDEREGWFAGASVVDTIDPNVPADAVDDWMLAQVQPLCNPRLALAARRALPGADGVEHGPYQALDYAASQQGFVYNHAGDDDVLTTSDERREHQLLATLARPAVIIGRGDGDTAMVHRVSTYGHTWLPAAHASNLSFHAAVAPKAEPPYEQSEPAAPAELENRVYIALVSDDADPTWAFTSQYHGAWNHAMRGTLPVTWTLDPLLVQRFPAAAEYFFSTRSPNDQFVPASGTVGYHHPAVMPFYHLVDMLDYAAEVRRRAYSWTIFRLGETVSSATARIAATRLPWLEGVAATGEAGGSPWVGDVPMLGAHPSLPTSAGFRSADGRLDAKALLDAITSLHDPDQPVLLALAGLRSADVPAIAELSGTLDDRFQWVTYPSLFRLASQRARSPSTPTSRVEGVPWAKINWREPSQWAAPRPVVEAVDGSLRIAIAPEPVPVALSHVRLPAEAGLLRMRIRPSDNIRLRP